MTTLRKFVKAKYDKKPLLKTYYGSFSAYFAHYLDNHTLDEWFNSMRNTAPSLGLTNHISRVLVETIGHKPIEIPRLLASLEHQYNIQVPVVEGILTVEYWERKAAQLGFSLANKPSAVPA